MTIRDPLTIMSCLLQRPELLRMAKGCIARSACLSFLCCRYLGISKRQSSSCRFSSRQVVLVSSSICQRKLTTFLLTGTEWPRGARNLPGLVQKSFSEEAVLFTKKLALVESMDKAGNLTGWLHSDGTTSPRSTSLWSGAVCQEVCQVGGGGVGPL